MDAEWHILFGGQKYGPYTGGQLGEFVKEGRITRESLLWAAGMAEWARADTIEGLFPAIPAPVQAINLSPPGLRSPHPPAMRSNPEKAFSGNLSPPAGGDFFSMGKYLAIRNGAVLPHVCPISNQPTRPSDWRKTVRIYCYPAWVIGIWVLSLGVGMIVTLAVQKDARITYSLSRKARNKSLPLRILGILLLLVGGVLAVSGFLIVYEDVAGLLRIVVAAVMMLVALAVLSIPTLRATRTENGWFYVTGCHPGFLKGISADDETRPNQSAAP